MEALKKSFKVHPILSTLIIVFGVSICLLIISYAENKGKEDTVERKQGEYLSSSEFITDYDTSSVSAVIYVNDEWMEHSDTDKRQFCVNVVKGLTQIRNTYRSGYTGYVALHVYHWGELNRELQAEVDINGNITIY